MIKLLLIDTTKYCYSTTIGFRVLGLLCFIFLVNYPLQLKAQSSTSSLHGIVEASDNNEQIPFASIGIYRADTTQLVKGTTTNLEGEFQVDGLSRGNYIVKIHFLGFQSQVMSVEVNEGDNDMGNISLVSIVQELQEVTVQAGREAITYEDGKMILNVKDNLDSEGGSALDVLEQAPSLEIDSDGKIKLKGKKPTILIDGVETDLDDMLEVLPADAIETIEIINNPSAKYDTRNGSGVINIKLKKDRKKGMTAKVGGKLAYPKNWKSTLFLGFRKEKSSVSASFNVAENRQNVLIDVSRENFDLGNKKIYLYQNKNGVVDNKTKFAQLKYDFFPNDKSVFNFKLRWSQKNMTEQSSFMNQWENLEHTLVDYSERVFKRNNKNSSTRYSLTYKKDLPKQGEIQVNIAYIHGDQGNDLNLGTDYYEDDFLDRSSYDNNAFLTAKKQFLTKLDYQQALSKKVKLELGYKLQMKTANNDNSYLQLDIPSNDWLPKGDKSNEFRYQEHLNSTYAVLKSNLNKFSMNLGARVERNDLFPHNITSEQKYHNQFTNFIPSIRIAFTASEKQNFQLSYSKRISIPSANRLNPFVDDTYTYSVSYGNPDLQPEKVHVLEVGGVFISDKYTINSSVYYRTIQDVIASVAELEGEVTHRTWKNLNASKVLGSSLNMNSQIAENWKLNSSFSLFNHHISRYEFPDRESVSWTSKLMSKWTLKKQTNIQITANYQSETITPQGNSGARYFVNAAISKKWIKKRLTTVLSCRDIFNTLTYDREIIKETFVSDSQYKRTSQMVLLSANYRFYKRS